MKQQFLLGSNRCAWEEVRIALGEHAVCKLVDQRPSLYEEVSKHGVRFPASQESNDVGVDIRTEKGHGTASAKGLCGNIFCCESNGWAHNGCGHVKSCSNVLGDHIVVAVGVIVSGKREVCGGAMLPVVQEPANGSMDGAAEMVAGCTLAKGLTMHAILLCVECVGDIVGHEEGQFREVLPGQDLVIVK